MARQHGQCQYVFPRGHAKEGQRCKVNAKSNGFCGMAGHGGRRKPGEAALDAAADSTNNARYESLLRGELTVQELDWEELRHGKIRTSDGKLSGMPVTSMPRQIAIAMQKEFLRRAEGEFLPDFSAAADTMRELMLSPRTPARERLAAAQYIMERAVGKIPEKQLLEIETRTYEAMLGDGPGSIFVDIPDSTGPASEATIKGEIAP